MLPAVQLSRLAKRRIEAGRTQRDPAVRRLFTKVPGPQAFEQPLSPPPVGEKRAAFQTANGQPWFTMEVHETHLEWSWT